MSRGSLNRGRVVAAAFLAVSVACGDGPPSSPSPPAAPAATITMTSAGVSPKNVDIVLGDRVLFVNNDTRAHSMGSNPHPDHTDCPNINQAGFLQPGQSRETGNFVAARVCGFHDHDNPLNQNYWGTITTR